MPLGTWFNGRDYQIAPNSYNPPAMHRLVERIIRFLRLAEVRPHLRPCKAWVDLGCHETYPLLRENRGLAERAWGLDLCVKTATDGDIELLTQDITRPLPFADGSKDLVTILAVLEHVLDPQAVLAECRRILAPGGRLVATTPTHLGIHTHAWLIKTGLVKDVRDDEHQDFDVSPALLDAWARKAGFEVEVARSFEFGMNALLVARRPER